MGVVSCASTCSGVVRLCGGTIRGWLRGVLARAGPCIVHIAMVPGANRGLAGMLAGDFLFWACQRGEFQFGTRAFFVFGRLPGVGGRDLTSHSLSPPESPPDPTVRPLLYSLLVSGFCDDSVDTGTEPRPPRATDSLPPCHAPRYASQPPHPPRPHHAPRGRRLTCCLPPPPVGCRRGRSRACTR